MHAPLPADPRPARVTALRAALVSALVSALAVVLPVSCPGCGAEDVSVCDDCLDRCEPAVRVDEIGGLRVWFSLDYADAVARLVAAFKNDGRTGLARVLAEPFGRSVDAAVAATRVAAATAATAGSAGGGVLVVPIPTRRASMRRRGYRPIALLARRAGVDLDARLRFARQPLDQIRLGRTERRDNLRSAMVADDRVSGRLVVVVDDVVTSGATLHEAVRAIRAAGGTVTGAAVLARTPAGRRVRRRRGGLL